MPDGRHDRAAELDPGGHDRRPLPDDGPVRAAAAARRPAAPLWGSEQHLAELFGDSVDFATHERATLEITAFERAGDYGKHFMSYYGPTIAARANAERNGRAEEFDAALEEFCARWNRSVDGPARFEKEYLLSVGTRR